MAINFLRMVAVKYANRNAEMGSLMGQKSAMMAIETLRMAAQHSA